MRTKSHLQNLYSLLMVVIVLALVGPLVTTAFGHLPHTPHYNGGSNRDGVGKYYPYLALDPEYTPAKTPTQIMFSIQDFNGNDAYNVKTMVEIYEDLTGKRVKFFPWTSHPVGDFEYYFTFPNVGNYQIVLSVGRDNSSIRDGMVDPARSILDSNVGCQCDRAIFNITVSNTWGEIRNFLFAIAVIMPIGVLGAVLGVSYFRGRKTKMGTSQNHDLIRYGVMLLAIAGGLVHLAIFPEHSSQQIYYSIFLLCAAAAQVAYGILYILVNLGQDFESVKDRKSLMDYYKRTLVVNLFGLVGTGILVGLYTYSVIFPPPLSPTNAPEVVDVAGILAKSVEVLLIVGIVSLMIWEKRKLRKLIVSLT